MIKKSFWYNSDQNGDLLKPRNGYGQYVVVIDNVRKKCTVQHTHCAVWMRRWVFKWSTRPNDLLNSLPFTFTAYHNSVFLPHMLSETTRFCTCVITFCALVWLFSSVNADVPLQSSCSVEWAPALFTLMWLLSTVGEKMLDKIFFLWFKKIHTNCIDLAFLWSAFWCDL